MGATMGMTSGSPSSKPARKWRPMSERWAKSGYGGLGSLEPR